MQFEYDPEQLIEEVKKRPGIWDYDHPDYRARNVKIKQWHDVVKELMSLSDGNLTKSEMKELELQLKKKWKSMRDSYQKYVLNPQKSKRPYIYSKHLQFILKDKKVPVLKRKVMISSESDDEDAPKNVWVKKKKIKLQKTDEDSEDNEVETVHDDFYEVSSEPAVAEVKSMPEGQFAFADVQSKSSVDPEDSDKMFLMSLLPHLRSIPEEFRLNVKLDLMQVLRVANESTAKLRYSSSLD